jgi:hypothetical protein
MSAACRPCWGREASEFSITIMVGGWTLKLASMPLVVFTGSSATPVSVAAEESVNGSP